MITFNTAREREAHEADQNKLTEVYESPRERQHRRDNEKKLAEVMSRYAKPPVFCNPCVMVMRKAA